MDKIIVKLGDYHIVVLDMNEDTLRVGVGVGVSGSEHNVVLVETLPLSDYPDLLAELYNEFGWHIGNVQTFAASVLGSPAERVELYLNREAIDD